MRNHWKKTVVAFCLILTASMTIDSSKHTCFPENNLYIPVNQESLIMSMDEATFNHVIDVVEDLYIPIVKAKGGDLVVERKWEDGTVNAYAQRVGKTYKVSMFGGLARHEAVTKEGFALVVCHEIGHHIGGAPKKASWWGASWASNEGQADYWGTNKCMKRVLEVLEEDEEELEESEDHKYARIHCDKRYVSQYDQALCVRSAMAGKSLAELFRALRRLPKELHFKDRDSKIVKKTNHSHPAPQCRIDTYLAGSLCDKDVNDEVSDTDEKQGVCTDLKDKMTYRPLCWFKPKEK